MPLSESEIKFVQQVARRAGEILMSYWPNNREIPDPTGKLNIQSKGDGTPVTTADHESSNFIEQELRAHFPDDVIVSEENTVEIKKIREASRVWIIDPLDGTRSFIRGDDDFSVLIALSEKGQVTAGFMYFPAIDQLAWSGVGVGAYRNEKDLKVSDATTLELGKIYVREKEVMPALARLKCIPMDSGLALMKVAAGELDGAVIRLGILQEWDVAAAICIIQESGGVVSDESGDDILVGTGDPHKGYFIATSKGLHNQLLGIVAEKANP